MPSRIEDYALIGDCHTAALVGRDGSMDWLCWPNFSSGACFARLLGTEENGFWRLAPKGKVTRTARRYEEHTLILETTHETPKGVVQVVEQGPRVRKQAPHPFYVGDPIEHQLPHGRLELGVGFRVDMDIRDPGHDAP